MDGSCCLICSLRHISRCNSPRTSLVPMSSVRVGVDDEDPLGRIIYSEGWVSQTKKVAGAYNGTLRYALDEGLTATFQFTGTSYTPLRHSLSFDRLNPTQEHSWQSWAA